MAPPDWAAIEAFLVGRCGMSQVQAARTSAIEIQHLIEGKNREQQELWEVARWVRWHDLMCNPYVKPGSRPATPKLMAPFPWEKPEREITPEECHIDQETIDWLNSLFGYDKKQDIESNNG
jgi:hypothetical protein